MFFLPFSRSTIKKKRGPGNEIQKASIWYIRLRALAVVQRYQTWVTVLASIAILYLTYPELNGDWFIIFLATLMIKKVHRSITTPNNIQEENLMDQ